MLTKLYILGFDHELSHEVRHGIFHLWYHVSLQKVLDFGFQVFRLGMLNLYLGFLRARIKDRAESKVKAWGMGLGLPSPCAYLHRLAGCRPAQCLACPPRTAQDCWHWSGIPPAAAGCLLHRWWSTAWRARPRPWHPGSGWVNRIETEDHQWAQSPAKTQG
jgi:hypothetical protein